MSKYFVVLLVLVLFLFGCSTDNNVNSESILLENNWEEILKEAKGTTVNFYMWGGDERINNWVDTFVAQQVKDKYGIEVNRVPMNAEEFINKLLGEKQVNRKKGSIDLLWINGENFRTAREADLLWGPFAEKLPNFNKYVNKESDDVKFDFGYPVEGYEVPYGKAQFVFAYDSSKVKNPPKSSKELLEWAKENPGRFTYPELPDFTGSVFIRHLMYELCGGYKSFPYVDKVDKNNLNEQLKSLWDYCNELEKYLWREGKTYPTSIAVLHQLFADGEVDFTMTYHPSLISGMIEKGLLPDTVRTFVWDKGTIGNTHFLAIPFNAPNKIGALVLANYLLSPEAQLSKYNPQNWGDMPGIDINNLPPEIKEKFNNIDLGIATLPNKELMTHRLPEVSSAYLPIIEELWKEKVVKE